MPYPATNNASVQPGSTLDLTFRPSSPGVVNVTLVGFGVPPVPTAATPHPPTAYTIRLHLELFKPGTSTPIAATDVIQRVVPPLSNRVVAFLNAAAGAGDLAGDWLARVTNRGVGAVTCRMTGRYQVLPGNLGKIDHIVVLMMENRSFDQMLGYLKLEGKRPEIEGLAGTETNPDANGVAIAVHPLATDGRARPTYFGNDPGHGWDDVVQQLQVDPVTGPTNLGFVKNFTKQLADQAKDLPPLFTTVHDVGSIDAEEVRDISFRPVLPGRVMMHTSLSALGQHSTTGTRAQLLLFRPGQSKAVASVILPFSSTLQSFGLTHDVTDAELAVPGNWTCEVSNGVSQAITFTTDVSFMVAEHDTRGQEPAAAIMGYYDAAQLPVYDVLASEFTVCDHWFASLPTDTWPNRLYALSGGSDGIRDTPSGKDVPKDPPGYTRKSIFELLQKGQIDWKIFYSDFPFPLVFKTIAQHAEYTARMQPLSNFLAAAQTGDLPSVSWLEPTFSDVEQAIARVDAANDDHPPGDVARGQALVQQVYDALSRGPVWSKTLLLITYDEHGGFYDHVAPPAQVFDDDHDLAVYGLRVPAFVVSPWVPRRSVSKDTYDHTSLLATILKRFCAGSVPSMGARTDHALDVGKLLSSAQLRAAPRIAPVTPIPLDGATASGPDGFGVVLRKLLIGF